MTEERKKIMDAAIQENRELLNRLAQTPDSPNWRELMEEGKQELWVESHFQEHGDLLVELAQIPAPSNHEEKRAAFCKEKLEARVYM